ncbi:conjugative transposon protein TraN [Chitinophaga sp. 22321]|uniref:conjugative transposon protein TraN n=1 Tax=Chitinophaga sp. 22321 TaxID=3453909 RepID=UPI003F83BCA5
MKSVVLIFFILSSVYANAQPAPLLGKYVMQSFSLPITYNRTTVLVFPAKVVDADRGYKDIIASKQAGADNVIKVKAARKGFEPTNLHVFTTNGHLYSFQVYYSDSTTENTFDLTKREASTGTTKFESAPLIMSEIAEDEETIYLNAQIIKKGRPFFHLRQRKFDMKLSLRSIYFTADKLYFCYRLQNKSNLPYKIDFSRMYISDIQKVKRTSLQQTEITPLYTSNDALVAGNSFIDVVLTVKKFTIPDGKKFKVEFYEQSGGRNISLSVRNRHIFHAKPL